MAEQKQTRTIVLALILLIALAGAGAYMYMSGGDTTPTTGTARTERATEAKPVQEAAPRPAPVPATPAAPAENAPLTLGALQYLPENAQVAVGIPPVTSLLANVAPLVQELFGDEMDVAHELGLIARDMAKELNVEESEDLAVVLAATGLDTTRGAAVFLDMEDLAKEAMETAMSQHMAPPDMSATKVVLVIPVTDGEKAEATLKKLTSDMLSGVAVSEEIAGDITINAYEGIGAYFVTDSVLAVGTDIGLLKQVAARENTPVQLRYGSQTCPPDDVHEASILVFGDKFIPVIEGFTSLMAQIQPEAMFFVETQLDQFKEMYEDGADDPLLVTLSIRDDVLELKSKIDTAVYPSLLENMGTAEPLRWPPMLPTNTLAFLTLSLTPEAKAQLKDGYLNNLPDEIRNSPGVSQGLQYGMPALEMLGQEITLAMTGMDPLDFPSIYLFVEVKNPQQAGIFLQMAPQLPHGEPHHDIQIKAINVPSPIQFYFAMINDVVVLSNNDEGIREVIDLVQAEKTSGFFESLQPPIASDTPVYQALLLKPELYNELVDPLLALSGRPLPREVGDIFTTLSALFKDIRFFSEMQDSWLVTRISVVRAPID